MPSGQKRTHNQFIQEVPIKQAKNKKNKVSEADLRW